MHHLMVDPRSGAAVYNSTTPHTITGLAPDSVTLPNGWVAVPPTLPNFQRLHRHGVPVPPVMKDYDWPGRFTPFEAQRLTANFLVLNKRAFVLSDMGTGKTNAALWAADYLMRQSRQPLRALIISPLSTLRRVWSDAIFNTFVGRRTSLVLHGSSEAREKTLKQSADFYIINFEGLGVGCNPRKQELRGFAKAFAERNDIQIVIIDEASAYKDSSTLRHKVARLMVGNKEYLWAMTGTPTPNGPTDAYGIAKLVNNAFGESFTSFKARTMLQVSNFKWKPRQGSHEMAYKLMSPSIRFAIDECVDLPECTVQTRDAELSSDQKALYNELKNNLKVAVKEKTINVANEGVLRSKLIQISCGAVYDDKHEAHYIDASPRLAVLDELVSQCAHKVIIFAPLTSVVEMVYKHLRDKRDIACAVVNGAVSDAQRSEIFRRFQHEQEPRIIVADPGTMAHGLTLTAATCIIWYAATDKTEVYLQANKRIHRPGQVHKTTIVQIAATATEREIYRRLEANESLQGAVLALAEER